MLRVNVDKMNDLIGEYDPIRTVGKLVSADGVLQASVRGSIGDLCRIELGQNRYAPGEVIGFRNGNAQILPYEDVDGLPIEASVTHLKRRLVVPCGWRMLGRVIDGLGRPIDGRGAIYAGRYVQVRRTIPPALSRPPLTKPFVTGQRVIDGLLTCGEGQRVGLFAGGGVGKTTLLAEIAKGCRADVNIIALIGERGREVRPFIENALGPEGLQRSVVVVATGDEPAVLRVRAAQTAASIANWFRAQGKQVLTLFDSLTRLAMAQREIGLLTGEPPSARGYPPSAFRVLAELLEQYGATESGSSTGIFTVLVDGDDVDEPVSDAVRALLDGHFVLTRGLAEKGHYPAIDVSQSVSRLFMEVTDGIHQTAARKIRQILATYAEVADLIRIGAYKEGASPRADSAVRLLSDIEQFQQQENDEFSDYDSTRKAMQRITATWKM
ncbi:MAG: FliI/YscN family ATPase [Planctomycetaceae bacterium]